MASSISARPAAARMIARQYITTAKTTASQARTILGVDASENDVEEELKTMLKLRNDCRAWAKDYVKQMQFNEAKNNQGMDEIENWTDIGELWSKDGSTENQQKMFQVMQGTKSE